MISCESFLLIFFLFAQLCQIAKSFTPIDITPPPNAPIMVEPFSNTNPAVKDLNTGFIGCFIDGNEPNRDMGSMIAAGATAPDGRLSCSSYKYFGLQDRGQLFCSNTFGNYASYVQVDDSECNLFGFQTGGSWRNAVFLTNFQPSTSTTNTTTTSTPTTTSTTTTTFAPITTSTTTTTTSAPITTSTTTTTTSAPITTSTTTSTSAPATTSTTTTSTTTTTSAPITTSTTTTTSAPITTSTTTTFSAPITTSTTTTASAPATTSTTTTSSAPITTSTTTTTSAPITTTTSSAPSTTSTTTTASAPISASTTTTTSAPITTSTTTTTSTPTPITSSTAPIVIPNSSSTGYSFTDYFSNNISWLLPTIICALVLFILLCVCILRRKEVEEESIPATQSVIIGIDSLTTPNKYAHRRFPCINTIIVPN